MCGEAYTINMLKENGKRDQELYFPSPANVRLPLIHWYQERKRMDIRFSRRSYRPRRPEFLPFRSSSCCDGRLLIRRSFEDVFKRV